MKRKTLKQIRMAHAEIAEIVRLVEVNDHFWIERNDCDYQMLVKIRDSLGALLQPPLNLEKAARKMFEAGDLDRKSARLLYAALIREERWPSSRAWQPAPGTIN